MFFVVVFVVFVLFWVGKDEKVENSHKVVVRGVRKAKEKREGVDEWKKKKKNVRFHYFLSFCKNRKIQKKKGNHGLKNGKMTFVFCSKSFF